MEIEASDGTSGADVEVEQVCGAIRRLEENPFGSLSYVEKSKVIKSGRPMPALPNLTLATKKCTRRFKVEQYDSISWIGGCKESNKLYCWPCLSFGNLQNTCGTIRGLMT